MSLFGSKYLFWAVVIITTALLIMLIIYGYNQSKKRKAVNIALREFEAWGAGSIKETSPGMRSALTKYWQAGEASDYGYSAAWSAAFISYLMKQAGAGSEFPYAVSHSTYIRKAVDNRNAGKRFGLVAYKPGERQPKIGDLICYPRQSGITFETDHAYDSHCDIVVAINKAANQVITIGGNVSNSVSKTIYPLNEKGLIVSNKVHAILQNPL